MLGEDLTVAGFGLWAPWDVADDRFYYDELNSQIKLHKGQNTCEAVTENLVYFTMDRTADRTHPFEATCSFGDSGSGALFEVDGELVVGGICSHGYYRRDSNGEFEPWSDVRD